MLILLDFDNRNAVVICVSEIVCCDIVTHSRGLPSVSHVSPDHSAVGTAASSFHCYWTSSRGISISVELLFVVSQ